MKPSLLLFLLLPITASFACINTPDGASLSGGLANGISDRPAFRLAAIAHSKSMSELQVTSVKTMPEVEKLELQALNLIYARNFTEALPLLEKANALLPGSYSLAANLGTNYELVGNNKAALEWIRKAVAIDPSSHRGSEWIHLLVLETKVRGENLGGTGFIGPMIPSPERLTPTTMLKVGGTVRAAEQVHRDLYYQLRERVQFVKPKDPYVADLLFSLAVLDANLSTVENAEVILNLAVEYGYNDQPKVEALRSALKRGQTIYRVWTTSLWIFGVAAVVALSIYAVREKWITLTRQTSPRRRERTLR